MRVMYHGSLTQAHGEGELHYDNENGWYYILTDMGHTLIRVKRESFTILEDA